MGEIVAAPFEFDLNETGFTKLKTLLARAEASRDVAFTRVGVEQAGHYHDTLVARLQDEGLDVVVLSPSQVKDNRSQNLLRSVKTDALDLAAIAELMIRGLGRRPELEDGPVARQAVLVAHRRRKVKARSALKNQVLATWDLVFPGLDGCFSDILSTKLGKVLRASNYGGAVGDITRFTGAAQLYRLSGLVPGLYESAGTRRGGQAISRTGKVELREAILELGKGLRHGHPDFSAYARQMKQRGKPGGVILCALGHRANRLAFAMMRDQVSFDPGMWPAREADGTPSRRKADKLVGVDRPQG